MRVFAVVLAALLVALSPAEASLQARRLRALIDAESTYVGVGDLTSKPSGSRKPRRSDLATDLIPPTPEVPPPTVAPTPEVPVTSAPPPTVAPPTDYSATNVGARGGSAGIVRALSGVDVGSAPPPSKDAVDLSAPIAPPTDVPTNNAADARPVALPMSSGVAVSDAPSVNNLINSATNVGAAAAAALFDSASPSPASAAPPAVAGPSPSRIARKPTKTGKYGKGGKTGKYGKGKTGKGGKGGKVGQAGKGGKGGKVGKDGKGGKVGQAGKIASTQPSGKSVGTKPTTANVPVKGKGKGPILKPRVSGKPVTPSKGKGKQANKPVKPTSTKRSGRKGQGSPALAGRGNKPQMITKKPQPESTTSMDQLKKDALNAIGVNVKDPIQGDAAFKLVAGGTDSGLVEADEFSQFSLSFK